LTILELRSAAYPGVGVSDGSLAESADTGGNEDIVQQKEVGEEGLYS